jgi:hypothetical protein
MVCYSQASKAFVVGAALLVAEEFRCDIRLQAEKMTISSGSVTHDRGAESIEAKAQWFRSLPLSDRMDMLCVFTDLALSINPALQERKHAQPVAGRIQVFSAA